MKHRLLFDEYKASGTLFAFFQIFFFLEILENFSMIVIIGNLSMIFLVHVYTNNIYLFLI